MEGTDCPVHVSCRMDQRLVTILPQEFIFCRRECGVDHDRRSFTSYTTVSVALTVYDGVRSMTHEPEIGAINSSPDSSTSVLCQLHRAYNTSANLWHQNQHVRQVSILCIKTHL